MKKLSIALTAGMLVVALTATAYASPLKNYNPGKVAIDAGVTLPTSIKGDNYKLSKSNSTYLGATAGIGSNMALNYKWNNYKADQGKTRAQQLNLMYKFLPGISAYAGYLNADTSTDFGGKTKNSGQVGLVAAYDIPLLFTVWGNIGVGNKNAGYEIGISKPILNNLEVNASYYDQKFNDAIADDRDVKAKGVNLGLTVKF
jgi:hypothetical protein